MADYRISEKIVKSIFIIVPAIVVLTPIALLLYFCLIGYAFANSPFPQFYEDTSISSIQNTLTSGEELSYLHDGEYLVSNSDLAKTYLYETLATKESGRDYDKKEDSELGFSYKLKIRRSSEVNTTFFFYLFDEENKIGVRISSKPNAENLTGFIRYYQYYTGETDYLLHEVMKI
jgi:hypothetical protein